MLVAVPARRFHHNLCCIRSSQGDALAKLLIEKGLITRDEYMKKLATERAAYQKLFNPTVQ